MITLGIKCTINAVCLNHPETIPTPSLWKNCLPRNQPLVPKRLETSVLARFLEKWGAGRGRLLVLRPLLGKTPWKGTSLFVPVRAVGSHCAGGPLVPSWAQPCHPRRLSGEGQRAGTGQHRGEAGREAKIAHVCASYGPTFSFQKARPQGRNASCRRKLPWGEGSGRKIS